MCRISLSVLTCIAVQQSFHQMASLLRRDNSSVHGADLRSTVPQPPETYDLTTEKVRANDRQSLQATVENTPAAS